jgi:hypothetical protein
MVKFMFKTISVKGVIFRPQIVYKTKLVIEESIGKNLKVVLDLAIT